MDVITSCKHLKDEWEPENDKNTTENRNAQLRVTFLARYGGVSSEMLDSQGKNRLGMTQLNKSAGFLYLYVCADARRQGFTCVLLLL